MSILFFQFVVDGGTRSSPDSVSVNTGWLWIAGVIFIILVSAFLVLHRLIRALRRPDLHGLNHERIKDTWSQVEHTSQQGLMGAKLAVIEADKLLDGVLRAMLFPGETMGERLKVAGYKYPAITKVWGAHRLRNQLVHDSAFEITARQAKIALEDYRTALKQLNVL